MKAHLGVLALLAISMTMLIVGASSSLATAQVTSPCTATLSYPVIPTQYGSPNVPFLVPVSASCPTYYQGQLYASGSAYDTTSNTGLGSASTVLSSVNGGTEFTGQLSFSVPPTSPGDSVQISVSIYDSQGGNLITTTGETIPVGSGVQQLGQTEQQIATTTVTEGQDPYANQYPTTYPSTYQPSQSPQYYQPQHQTQGHQTHFFSQGFAYRSNNTNLFDYMVIIAIIASVIIATTGLVLVARRQQQPTWYPWPPQPRQ